jgi:hypothetical protein
MGQGNPNQRNEPHFGYNVRFPKQVTIFKKLPKALNFLLKIRGISPASKY